MKLIIVLLVLTSLVHAQPDALWTRLYHGNGTRNCYDSQRTADGGFILGGAEYSLETENDFFVIKTDAEGEPEWSTKLIDEWGSGLSAITEIADSSLFLVGSGRDPAEGAAIIARITSDGDSLWMRHYGGQLAKLHASFPNEQDGTYACGATSDSGRFGGYDGYLLNIDSDGEIIWSQVYGDRNTDIFWDMIRTSDGGFAFCGESSSFGNGIQFYLVKADSTGEEEWSAGYGGEHRDVAMALVQTPDGGFALAGFTNYRGENGRLTEDWMFLRVDAEGEELWTRYFGDDVNSERCRDLILKDDGGFVLVGSESNTYDVYLIRTDDVGDTLWTAKYDVFHGDKPYTIIHMEDGSYTVTGRAQNDFFMLRTEPDPLAVPRLLDPAYPSDFTVNSAYPNPFNATTTIGFCLPERQQVSLQLFDLTGRLVETLIDDRLEAGRFDAVWNADMQAAGVYFYRLQAGDFVQTRKLMLVK